LRNNIRVAKLTEAIIKLKRELDKAKSKKKSLKGESELKYKIIQLRLILRG